ncbi:MAG: nuclear transport factor 2 family protein [Pseudomonadales bacterium]
MTMTSPQPVSEPSKEIIKRFKALYKNLDATRAACAETGSDNPLLAQIYSDSIEFRDPLHLIHGLSSLRSYMNKMYGNTISCEFIFLGDWITEPGPNGKGSACIKWDMIFRHSKLAAGSPVTVRGMSHIRFGDRIDYHEDIFDVGAMLYEHVPLMGRVVLWLKSRLSL